MLKNISKRIKNLIYCLQSKNLGDFYGKTKNNFRR